MNESTDKPVYGHSKKHIHRRKSGLPPGTPVYTGSKHHTELSVSIINYNESSYTEEDFKVDGNYLVKPPEDFISWININGLHNEKVIGEIGNFFKLHNLILEDILNVFQLPKVDEYTEDEIIYVTLNEFYFENKLLQRDQISLILGKGFVISFQEDEGDYFEVLRDRIRSGKGKMRKMGSDYLLYVLIDAIVDSYFIVLDHYSAELDKIETNIFAQKNKNHLAAIHHVSKDFIYLRRSIAPLREVVIKLMKEDIILIEPDCKHFLRDLQDHINQVINQIDTDREYLADMVQSNMANMNSYMNEIIKVLTLVSAIFIPLTFLVGVYGMNFEKFPELTWQYGYAGIWVVMIIITIIQFIIYKKKKWL